MGLILRFEPEGDTDFCGEPPAGFKVAEDLGTLLPWLLGSIALSLGVVSLGALLAKKIL